MIATQQIDDTFAALADPTRRAILAQLAEGEARVSDVARPHDMSLNAVSKHLKVLERAGLVRRRIEGREHILSFEGTPLAEAGDWLNFYRQFWSSRLDNLARFLGEQHAGPGVRGNGEEID